MWAYVEADLQREYGIDAAQIGGMSWRRFSVLLRGLSPQSMFSTMNHEAPTTDPEDAERLVEAALG